MNNKEKNCKLWLAAAGEAFTICTIVMLLKTAELDRLALAFGTLVLTALPLITEKLFSCRMRMGLYIFALLYALGPMLGHCWKLYYILPGWDKVLHICGGVMFVFVGVFFFERMTVGKQPVGVCVLFAFCFSVCIAGVWELTEFAADCLLGTDMQNDTYISSITSYLLGEQLGQTGCIDAITSVSVNGVSLRGYIDIGLVDSMLDMLLETLGAALTCAAVFLDRKRTPLICDCRCRKEERGDGT